MRIKPNPHKTTESLANNFVADLLNISETLAMLPLKDATHFVLMHELLYALYSMELRCALATKLLEEAS